MLHIAVENLRREPQFRSTAAIEGWCASINRAADALEGEVGGWGDTPTVAHIALGTSLGYCDYRAAQHIDWRAGRPALTAWHQAFEHRPSMQATRPV